MGFYGEFEQRVDAKGRVSIPADFRRVLEQGDPDWTGGEGQRPRVRIVFGDLRRKYLEAYTITAFQRIEARIAAMPESDPRQPILLDLLIQGSDGCTVDDDGRIVLNQRLRDRLRLPKDGGTVWYAGRLKSFRIWLPEDFEADKAAKQAAVLNMLGADADILSLLPPDAGV